MDLLFFLLFFCLVFAVPLCASVCALRSPAGKGLATRLSFVVYSCEFVTFRLVSWVRCGTRLYRFLIFAPFVLVINIKMPTIVRRILAHICQIEWNLISFDDGNDKNSHQRRWQIPRPKSN